MHIIQGCEVTGVRVADGRVAGVDTTQGFIAAKKIGIAVAGHSSRVAAMAGLRVPIESHVLQALVTEPVKPCLDTVVTSGAVHYYVSQSDRASGVGGTSTGTLPITACNLPAIGTSPACLSCFPSFSRLRMRGAGAASWI